MDKNIVLIGMPGCGKTTIGEALSKDINIPFYDCDKYIENKEGRRITDIFKAGEDAFRAMETESLMQISKECPCIISTGGGVVKRVINIDILKENGIIFFINRPIELIKNDIDIGSRPLLAGGVDILHKLYNERFNLYSKYCHYEILNDTSVESAQIKIYKILEVMK